MVRDHINDEYAQMSDDQISQQLRVLGDEGHLRDTPGQRRERLIMGGWLNNSKPWPSSVSYY